MLSKKFAGTINQSLKKVCGNSGPLAKPDFRAASGAWPAVLCTSKGTSLSSQGNKLRRGAWWPFSRMTHCGHKSNELNHCTQLPLILNDQIQPVNQKSGQFSGPKYNTAHCALFRTHFHNL